MLRGRQAFSAVGSRNLGKRQRRDSHSRRTLPAFTLKSIVRSKKTKRAIGKLFLIPDPPLRHIDYAPRHDLAHNTGIGRPGALASRLEEPALIKEAEGILRYSRGSTKAKIAIPLASDLIGKNSLTMSRPNALA